MPENSGMRMARRTLLSNAAASALLLVFPSQPGKARGFDLARFLRLSEKLTAHSDLSPEVGAIYLRNLASFIGPDRQGDAVSGGGQADLQSRIVADWYSGQAITSKGIVCVDYTGALVWEAIGFAKPRGIADSESGRWALAPF